MFIDEAKFSRDLITNNQNEHINGVTNPHASKEYHISKHLHVMYKLVSGLVVII